MEVKEQHGKSQVQKKNKKKRRKIASFCHLIQASKYTRYLNTREPSLVIRTNDLPKKVKTKQKKCRQSGACSSFILARRDFWR